MYPKKNLHNTILLISVTWRDDFYFCSKTRMIDVLFINAAQIKLSPISDTTEKLFDEMIDVNFKGAYFSFQKVFTTSYTIGFGGNSLLSVQVKLLCVH